jgi:hypothetical protein
MKSISLLFLLCADVALSASVGQSLEKRQSLLQLLFPSTKIGTLDDQGDANSTQISAAMGE